MAGIAGGCVLRTVRPHVASHRMVARVGGGTAAGACVDVYQGGACVLRGMCIDMCACVSCCVCSNSMVRSVGGQRHGGWCMCIKAVGVEE